jgi:hypothetical protein
VVEQLEQGREILFDQAYVALCRGSANNEEPTTLNEVWNHEEPKDRENWQAAINKEIDEMNSETGISVTGFIVYLMNAPICWR